MLKPRSGAEGSGAPDANKVWNKNRPAPPQPAKQFTDEELKQQYGIHLATRLQADDSKKESTWADIDEDEEDWVPDSVVWMDGTKSTLASQDLTPVPAQDEHKSAAPQTAKPTEGTRPVLAMRRAERPGQAMRILKPGAAAQLAEQQGGKSSPSPGPQKSSLTSKSPAPAPPTKSPWAPVPKPDAVSPINPPVQQLPPRLPMPSQDARASEPMPPPPPPAREIAADTFDRSWKNGEGGARELFNSNNGRYEPAPEARRSSMRQENHRKPAVLQRPSQAGPSPAEPSAAFQSRSSSQMDGSWGRRRGSSVSQGSIPPARRMSVNRPSELSGTPENAPLVAQPSTAARNEAPRPNFTQPSPWDSQMPTRPQEPQQPPVEAAPPVEDPVVVQERIMKQKRETARQRKEDEERDEAAKQERLKAKLAALEGAGKSRSQREAEAAAAAAAAATAQAPSQPVVSPEHAAQPVAAKTTPLSPLDPSKPVALIDSQPLPKAAPSVPAQQQRQPQSLPDKEKMPSPSLPKQQAGPFGQPQHSNIYRAPTSSYSSPGERKPQPAAGLGRSPLPSNDTFTPWPSTAPSQQSVWGGLSGIGNGIFTPIAQPGAMGSLPPPSGLPRQTNSARISPQGFNADSRSPSLGHPQISEQRAAYPPPGIAEPRSDPFASSQARLNGMSPAPGHNRPGYHPPGPIGPPSRAPQQQQQQTQQAQRPDAIRNWNNATYQLPQQYRDAQISADERRQQEAANPPPPVENRFKETFKKTSSNQGTLGGARRYESVEMTIHDGSGSRTVTAPAPMPPSTQTQPPAPVSSASPAHGSWNSGSNNTVRMPDPSRNPAHGGRPGPIAPPSASRVASKMTQQISHAQMKAPLAPATLSKEQSPPPPESESHPVNEGDHRPHVKLPTPQPKVRLPPMSQTGIMGSMQGSVNGSVTMPQRTFSNHLPPGAARPIAQSEGWQARFNGLFGKQQIQTETPPSPPKTPEKAQGSALAVASSSRAQMDTQISSATVSLPHTRKAAGRISSVPEPTMTKSDIDFNDERSFGSLPKVCVPRITDYNTRSYSTHKLSRNALPIESGFHENPHQWRSPVGAYMRIPDTRLNNKCAPWRSRDQNKSARNSNNRQQGAQKSTSSDKKRNAKNVPAPASSTPARQTKETPQGSKKSPAQKADKVAKKVSPSPTIVADKPTTAREALTDKRKSGGSKHSAAASTSTNRFEALAMMTSPSKN